MERQNTHFVDVLRVPEFRALWAADLLSVLGDQLARVTLSVLVYDRTSSALLTALTYALTFVPSVLGGALLAGLADRLPRREVMVVTDLLRATLAGVMAIPALSLPSLWILLAVLTAAGGPFKAAQLALIPQILSGDRYVSGMALRQITSQTAQLVGFGAGGALLVIIEPHVGLAINAATFAASAILVWGAVRARPAARSASVTPPGRIDSGAGRRRRFVPLSLVSLVILVGLYVVPEGIAAPYAHSLGLGSAGVGLLMAADPVGSVIGGWLVARLRLPRSTGIAALLAVAGALPLVVCVLHPGFGLSLALWAVSGALSTAYLIQAQALVVEAVPNEFRGRVLGRMSTGMYTAQGVAILLGGFVAQAARPTVAVSAAGLLAVVAAGLIAVFWWSARPRRLRESEQATAEDDAGGKPTESVHHSLLSMAAGTSSPQTNSTSDAAPAPEVNPASSAESVGDASLIMRWRGWKLWSLPTGAVALVIGVTSATVALTVVESLRTPITAHSLTYFAIIVALGLLTAEATRGVERMRRRFSDTPHVNMNSVWTLAAAIVTTPGLAAATVVILYVHLRCRTWYRIEGISLHKIVYNASVVALSCFSAATLLHHLPAGLALDVSHPLGLLGMLAIILCYSAVNTCLVGMVIALAQGDRSLRRLVGSWRDNSLEYATLCVGMMAAVMLLWRPWLVVLILLPLYVLHRSVLVRQLEHAATTDAKTGLLNATTWNSLTIAELERSRRHGSQLSVLMADLDHFKRINDSFGHLIGDNVLRAVADSIRQQIGSDGLCGRFGGEEFVMTLPGAGLAEAVDVANGIRRHVAALVFNDQDQGLAGLGISLSIGVASYPDAGQDLDELLRAADNALFLAKDRGRDQVQAVQGWTGGRRPSQVDPRSASS